MMVPNSRCVVAACAKSRTLHFSHKRFGPALPASIALVTGVRQLLCARRLRTRVKPVALIRRFASRRTPGFAVRRECSRCRIDQIDELGRRSRARDQHCLRQRGREQTLDELRPRLARVAELNGWSPPTAARNRRISSSTGSTESTTYPGDARLMDLVEHAQSSPCVPTRFEMQHGRPRVRRVARGAHRWRSQ
jgi:hypothetical protein